MVSRMHERVGIPLACSIYLDIPPRELGRSHSNLQYRWILADKVTQGARERGRLKTRLHDSFTFVWGRGETCTPLATLGQRFNSPKKVNITPPTQSCQSFLVTASLIRHHNRLESPYSTGARDLCVIGRDKRRRSSRKTPLRLSNTDSRCPCKTTCSRDRLAGVFAKGFRKFVR